MISQEIRTAAIERFQAGAPTRQVVRELRIAESTAYKWRRDLSPHPPARPRRPPARRLRPMEKPICGADLGYPDPRLEAKACLRFAKKNGGVEHMRRTIRITPEQERTLHHLADTGEISLSIVIRAIEYRRQVLEAFNWLAANEASNAVEITFAKEIAACEST